MFFESVLLLLFCCCPAVPGGCLWLRCVWLWALTAGPRGGESPLQHIAGGHLILPPDETCVDRWRMVSKIKIFNDNTIPLACLILKFDDKYVCIIYLSSCWAAVVSSVSSSSVLKASSSSPRSLLCFSALSLIPRSFSTSSFSSDTWDMASLSALWASARRAPSSSNLTEEKKDR